MRSIRELLSSEYPWDLLLLADPSRRLVEEYLQGSVVLGIEEDGAIYGVVVITPVDLQSWEIKNVAVTPGRHGQGLGKALLLRALAESRKRGARTVWIGTGNSSINQLALYQKVGFQIVGIDRDFFTRNYDHEILEDGIRCQDMVRLVFSWVEKRVSHH